jgi:transcriptional regulator with XRE-family HTH domain
MGGNGNVVILMGDHALASISRGYKSGRNSYRETPEARSTWSTRNGGTSSHCATACLVTPSDAASLVRPPAASMARSSGVFDMMEMSSTASHESQVPLHLQRQAELYHLDMTLGNLIRKARKAKKLTLQGLADKMGVSKQLVWQWEKDDSDARTHIKGLSLHLEVPVDYFYGTKRSPAVLEAKIKLLAPSDQDLVDAFVETLLQRREQEEEDAAKKA